MDLSYDEIILVTEDKMEKAINSMEMAFGSVRAGRANPKILDRIAVDYYGAMTPINQTSNITVSDARTIVVSPWDASLVREIVKQINDANMGVSVSDDGKVVRLAFPILTEDRRRELGKEVKKLLEDCRIALRQVRKNAMDNFKELKKESLLTEDGLSDAEKSIQKMIDSYNEKAEKSADKKIAEIMEV